ncbi:hypothetical protein AJ79_08279 [Helicocarpus griseus UAMH5409]|uniref:Cation efflux protein transmembrane domain-containing protein n=1 Tax=Helicocarpus griseus UAMH5409 TaxID=1447875 RepID=A0A2B7WLC5_9EURO|nr:hypothetical protein AJ79_08279 [Helicocarpus griseus UAMH5409]
MPAINKIKLDVSLRSRLLFIIVVSISFILAELVVGFTTHSVAVVADAFHYIGDVLSFVVALLAEKWSTPEACIRLDERIDETECPEHSIPSVEAQKDLQGRGYHIIPNLAAFFNSVFLLALGLGIFLQAIERFVHVEREFIPGNALVLGGHGHSHPRGHSHDGNGKRSSHSHVPILSAMSPAASPTELEFKHHSHPPADHTLSIKAVLLHITADALNNVAVIISALIMWKAPPKFASPESESHKPLAKHYADPACTMLIAILIMLGSAPLVIRAGKALMEQAAARENMRVEDSGEPMNQRE